MDIERRFVVAETEDDLILEDRANGQTAIVGYAAVYNRLSVDLGGFREEILPGAFDKVLKRNRGKSDVLALVNHDQGQVLGRTSSGTLELSSTEKGLRYAVTPPDTQVGRDTVSLLRRGDLRSSSFAFTVSKAGESFRTSEDGRTIRQVREVSGLYDVSVVTTPAYPDSSAAVSLRSCDCEVARRSYQAWLAEQQQPEQAAVRSVMSAVAASVASLLRLKLRG